MVVQWVINFIAGCFRFVVHTACVWQFCWLTGARFCRRLFCPGCWCCWCRSKSVDVVVISYCWKSFYALWNFFRHPVSRVHNITLPEKRYSRQREWQRRRRFRPLVTLLLCVSNNIVLCHRKWLIKFFVLLFRLHWLFSVALLISAHIALVWCIELMHWIDVWCFFSSCVLLFTFLALVTHFISSMYGRANVAHCTCELND